MRTRAYFYLNLLAYTQSIGYCSAAFHVFQGLWVHWYTVALTSYVFLPLALGLHSFKILKAILSSIAFVMMLTWSLHFLRCMNNT